MKKSETIYKVELTENEIRNIAEALEIARTVCKMEEGGKGICGLANANELMKMRDEFAKLIDIAFLTYQDLAYNRIADLVAEVNERISSDL